jgi:uncharacterized protein YbjT (DUF2867 family)
MILVTGATGNVGSELVKKLSARGEKVRAFVRNRSQTKAIALPGVEFVEGDFSNPSSFVRALAAVDRLFLLMPSSADVERQQKECVDAGRQSAVRHIVYLSQLGADERSKKGRFQRYHGAVENHIRKSGISFTFLRPNLFMQGLLNFRASISSQGAIYAPAGNATISVVDVRDIAAVAERALTEPGHDGKVYEITGPESLTHGEMAATLSLVLGKPVKHVDVSPTAMREALLAFGLPQWQAEGVVEDYDQYRDGEAAAVASTVREVTGAQPLTFGQFARDYAGKFLGKAAGA